MSLPFAKPECFQRDWPNKDSYEDAYGKYVVEGAFFEHLKEKFPTLTWHEPGDIFEFPAKLTGATIDNVLSYRENIALSNAFHSNTEEVQLLEAYEMMCAWLEGYADSAKHGVVNIMFNGFRIANLMNPRNYQQVSALKLYWCVVFQPFSEQTT